MVPGCTPERIKPDLVHSFHIGFGTDLAASIIVWLSRLDKFGRLAFDERLRVAYSTFQEYCHEQKRYNSCDEWCLKKMGMTSNLWWQMGAFSVYPHVFSSVFPVWLICFSPFLTAFHFVCLGALTSRPAWVARAMTRPWFAGGWRSYCWIWILGMITNSCLMFPKLWLYIICSSDLTKYRLRIVRHQRWKQWDTPSNVWTCSSTSCTPMEFFFLRMMPYKLKNVQCVCVFLYWFSFIFFNLTVWDFATSWILKGEKIDT